MPYAKGTVYKIICNVDSKFVYIGSTFNELRFRFQQHKQKYRQWIAGNASAYCSCFDYFKKYGLENFTIIRIKEYVCWCENKLDKKHLHAYEQLWINNTRNCCNKYPAFHPLRKEQKRQYHQDPVNKERRRENEKNKNPELKKSNSLARKVKITCDRCGSTVRKVDIARHRRTKKCMSAV